MRAASACTSPAPGSALARSATRTGGTRTSVAGLQALIGPGARAVDPHFAAAHDAVDTRARHALQAREQKIVQPLSGLFLVHLDETDTLLFPDRLLLHRESLSFLLLIEALTR